MNTAQKITLESLPDFLKDKIGRVLSIPPSTIDPDQPLASYGLDSMSAVVIVGELEEKLETELPTTLLWDCPTLNQLFRYLNEHVPGLS